MSFINQMAKYYLMKTINSEIQTLSNLLQANKEKPTKKIIIAGSRTFENYTEARNILNSYLNKNFNYVIISGKCRGADKLGEKYAKEKGFEIIEFPADWEKFGKKAGPIRNEAMIKECDEVFIFWDGRSRGTKNLIELAKRFGKTLKACHF